MYVHVVPNPYKPHAFFPMLSSVFINIDFQQLHGKRKHLLIEIAYQG